MMWSIVILLAAATSVESYIVHDQYERLAHGRQLRIFLPKGVEKLEFTPADDPSKTFVYWERARLSMKKGRVSGTGSDRRWYIDQVTYEDQGTYVQRDFWNKEMSTVRVGVTPRHNYVKCVAGESLYISLEGIDLVDAILSFSGSSGNVTLVRDGSRTSQDLPEYWDRVKTSSNNIEIRNVNYSDVGHYTLIDRRDRVVSVTRMDLTDHHEHTSGSPLMALLLLLGIPAWICCCCRKKIFRPKPTTATVLQTMTDAVQPSPGGPAGPCPPYNVYYHGPDSTTGPTVHPPPTNSDPGQWIGPPPPAGFDPANPAYPPVCPAMIPPAQPPQWNGQYPPGMGYAPAPVMYSSPPPAAGIEPFKQDVKMENVASSPADPLLTAAPQVEAASCPVAPVPPSSTNALSTSDATYQFQINGEKSNSFL
ncbi:uncharacterized protein wu:fc21g02 [Anabas testudineus]|uniref:Immunoglobulin subtype domain-containing protein n=1 Tax=Anabas testudineus TaxID=64144 RepID=A0A7N6B8A5_ANATE|nr:uncharacterized protein wu:fc21g02 [Anabas testudineus]XP_026214601.1 uncharacterized protein wu:fc21g02 [Anabas testudineus]